MASRLARRPVAVAVLASLVGVALTGCGPSSHAPAGASTTTNASGTDARTLLAATTYRSLLVRVDYAKGLAPSPAALALLEDRLAKHLDKPDGVRVEAGSELALDVPDVVTLAESRALEASHRTVFASATQGVLYVLYLPGESERDVSGETTLGWSLTATSFAVFARTVQTTARGLAAPSVLEGAVLVHEAGHLLGLVNHGTPMLSAHEDLARPAHCTSPGCILGAQCTSWDLATCDLCPECAADVRANGGR